MSFHVVIFQNWKLIMFSLSWNSLFIVSLEDCEVGTTSKPQPRKIPFWNFSAIIVPKCCYLLHYITLNPSRPSICLLCHVNFHHCSTKTRGAVSLEQPHPHPHTTGEERSEKLYATEISTSSAYTIITVKSLFCTKPFRCAVFPGGIRAINVGRSITTDSDYWPRQSPSIVLARLREPLVTRATAGVGEESHQLLV